MLSTAAILAVVLTATLTEIPDSAPNVRLSCQTCRANYFAGVLQHWFENYDAEFYSCAGTDGGCHSSRIRYACDVNHNPCARIATELFEELLRHIEVGNTSGVVRILKHYSDRVRLVRSRSVVQVHDCGGVVVVSLAVGNVQASDY